MCRRAIFESFEPPSSDEGDSDYDNDDDDDDDDESDQDEGQSTPLDGPKRTGKDVDDGETAALSGALQKGRISDSGMNGIPASSTDGDHNDADDGNIDEDEEEGGTGVVMSQLRHFVIQEYMPRPMLFDITQTPGDAGFEPISGNKVSHLPSVPSCLDALANNGEATDGEVACEAPSHVPGHSPLPRWQIGLDGEDVRPFPTDAPVPPPCLRPPLWRL
jgi:hypothetical protein